METKKIVAIVDYGLGNLFSLSKVFEHLSCTAIITSDPMVIEKADALILPGVGAFAAGMEGLKKKNLIKTINLFALSEKPMLGICLGAQLLLSKGFEFGENDGLNIIPGNVKMFPKSVSLKEKVPHIGWNNIYQPEDGKWKDTIFNDITERSDVYFVHSYIMITDDKSNNLSITKYGDLEFVSSIRKNNIYGTQFHPEKSGEVGLTIIKNFINLIK